MHRAYAAADMSAMDTGHTDLVHSKYMVIDPFGAQPLLIHGSANWSTAALTDTNDNDENANFIPHAGIARMFYAHFKHVTGALPGRRDFWWDLPATPAPGVTARLWATDTNALMVQTATNVAGSWANTWTNRPAAPGYTTYTNTPATGRQFFRAIRP